MFEVRHSDFGLRHSAGPWPAVTCVCPTYGRFACLRLALAGFLAQDYPGEKRLLILNDAPEPIRLPNAGTGNVFADIHADAFDAEVTRAVVVLNDKPGTHANLGEKRQALLQASSTELAAHWDDDDLYLPWHLTRSVSALLERDVGCVKSGGGWYMKGVLPSLSVRGPCHNVFEGTMVFGRDEALELGGYPPLHSGQAKALMRAFKNAGRFHAIPDDYPGPSASSLKPPACVSYVYRWANGLGHISSIGNQAQAREKFRRANRDFGNGAPLTPGDLAPYWRALEPHIRRYAGAADPNRQSQIGNRK